MLKHNTAAMLALLCAACASAPQPQQSTHITASPAEIKQLMVAVCQRPEFECIDTPITVSLVERDGSKFQRVLESPTPIIQNGSIRIYSG